MLNIIEPAEKIVSIMTEIYGPINVRSREIFSLIKRMSHLTKCSYSSQHFFHIPLNTIGGKNENIST